MRYLVILAALIGLSFSLYGAEVPVLHISDTINPGTGDYIISAIEAAESAQAPHLILELDTPGGLLSTTRQVVQKMLNSDVPIVVLVGPRGAHAGSAGALITFAADIAAMTPGTNIGAAHPVTPGEQPDKVMAAKMANDTAAFAESIAKTRGRNTEWAAKAVKESASISAEEALKQGVIDLVVEDLPTLQARLAGYKLKAPKGQLTALPTEAVTYRDRPMTLKHRAVSFFANPNLAYLIMSLGALCLWLELSHPGLILPGVVGLLCILVSLVSFQLLPISYGALALILVGFALIVAELFLPTFGVLGVGGILAFIVGSLFLMDTQSPHFQISLALILPTAAVLASAAAFISYSILKAQRKKNASGLEAMVGEYGEVREAISQTQGMVFVQGELWNAVTAEGEIPKGAIVVVKEVRGMQLLVSPQGHTPA